MLFSTLRRSGEPDAEAFYRGDIARKIDEQSRRDGGYIRYEDYAAFHPRWVEPISVNYRGFDVCEIPPNGQGIVALMAARWTDRISDLIVCGANTRPRALKRRAYMDIRWEHRQDPNIYNTILLTEPHIPAEDLRAIEVRTLVVAGSRDIIRERNTRFIAETIPNAELLILPGEDHGSYIDHSDRIAYIILDFCG